MRLNCRTFENTTNKSLGKTKNSDEHWELLQLERLSDTAHAPLPNEEMLHEFTELLPIHLTHFKKLYPELNIIPKQHFMVHIPNMVRDNGPLNLNCCLKYEIRNTLIKRPAQAISCLQNITKALIERNQLTSLQLLSFRDLFRDKYVFLRIYVFIVTYFTTHKVRNVLVSNLPGWDIISRQFSIDKDNFIQTCNRIQFCVSSYIR